MCGRYALYGPTSRLQQQFVIPDDIDELPRDMPNPLAWYNIAPSQTAPVILAQRGGVRQIIYAKWGLLPSWVKVPGTMAAPINARVETVGEKPMFRSAWRRCRIIVPACGFYEWRTVADQKQPYYIHPTGDALFGFAGLLEKHGDVFNFALLTTTANSLMEKIHDRMPVILRPADYAAWLDPGITDSDFVRPLAGKYPAALMAMHPVGRTVGNPRSQGAQLIEPIVT